MPPISHRGDIDRCVKVTMSKQPSPRSDRQEGSEVSLLFVVQLGDTMPQSARGHRRQGALSSDKLNFVVAMGCLVSTLPTKLGPQQRKGRIGRTERNLRNRSFYVI